MVVHNDGRCRVCFGRLPVASQSSKRQTIGLTVRKKCSYVASIKRKELLLSLWINDVLPICEPSVNGESLLAWIKRRVAQDHPLVPKKLPDSASAMTVDHLFDGRLPGICRSFYLKELLILQSTHMSYESEINDEPWAALSLHRLPSPRRCANNWHPAGDIMDNYHVVPASGGWKLHAQSSEEALISAPTKARLMELLPSFMDGRTGSVKIHTETGQLEEERTYPRNEDPRRSKG